MVGNDFYLVDWDAAFRVESFVLFETVCGAVKGLLAHIAGDLLADMDWFLAAVAGQGLAQLEGQSLAGWLELGLLEVGREAVLAGAGGHLLELLRVQLTRAVLVIFNTRAVEVLVPLRVELLPRVLIDLPVLGEVSRPCVKLAWVVCF